MYLVYTIILLVLILVLGLTLREEIMIRKGLTNGMVNKYWALREKRRFVRFREDMKIRFSHVDPHSGGDIKMANISKKGLCVSTYEKLKKKDILSVEIEVPGFSKPVNATGIVMWVKELRQPDKDGRRMFYTGMRFEKIDPESEAILITHLSTLKRP